MVSSRCPHPTYGTKKELGPAALGGGSRLASIEEATKVNLQTDVTTARPLRLGCECGAIWVERLNWPQSTVYCPSCSHDLEWDDVLESESDINIVGEGLMDLTAPELDVLLRARGLQGGINRGPYAYDEGRWIVEDPGEAPSRPRQTLAVGTEVFKDTDVLKYLSVAFFLNGDLASLAHVLDRDSLTHAVDLHLRGLRR